MKALDVSSVPNRKTNVLFVIPENTTKGEIVLKDFIEWAETVKSILVLRIIVVINQLDYPVQHRKIAELCKKKQLDNFVVNDLSLKSFSHEIEKMQIDILISCGWGWKISDDAIRNAKIAAINCHSSYLPDYKGGSVYNYYWANCERKGGATIHFMTNKFDSGNIICQGRFLITLGDSPHDILIKASETTALLLRTAFFLIHNDYEGIPHQGGRYFFKVGYNELKFHRFVNRLSSLFKLKYRWLTKYKKC